MAMTSVTIEGAGNPAHLWREGRIVPWQEATVHVNAVGQASVSAVFEGIKAYWNQDRGQLNVFRLAEHMRRMIDSVRLARIRIDHDAEALAVATLELLRANEERRDVYIRPYAFLKGIVRVQMAPADSAAEVVIDSWPFRSHMLTERGVRVCVSSWRRIGEAVMPPRVKAYANYHNGRYATMEAKASGYDQPIMLNEAGKVTEGPGACVALIKDGVFITPPLASGVLESITRASLMELAADRVGLEVREREVDRTELYLADEMFFMGTGWEILPILSVDGLAVGGGAMGALTRELDALFHGVLYGVDNAYAAWRTPVW